VENCQDYQNGLVVKGTQWFTIVQS